MKINLIKSYKFEFEIYYGDCKELLFSSLAVAQALILAKKYKTIIFNAPNYITDCFK